MSSWLFGSHTSISQESTGACAVIARVLIRFQDLVRRIDLNLTPNRSTGGFPSPAVSPFGGVVVSGRSARDTFEYEEEF